MLRANEAHTGHTGWRRRGFFRAGSWRHCGKTPRALSTADGLHSGEPISHSTVSIGRIVPRRDHADPGQQGVCSDPLAHGAVPELSHPRRQRSAAFGGHYLVVAVRNAVAGCGAVAAKVPCRWQWDVKLPPADVIVVGTVPRLLPRRVNDRSKIRNTFGGRLRPLGCSPPQSRTPPKSGAKPQI